MEPIVIELQREAMDSASDISNLLRKSMIIAKKLKIEDFEKWVNLELNSYEQSQLKDIPNYRSVRGNVQWFNEVRGWCPLIIEDQKTLNMISTIEISQSIPELSDLLKSKSSTLSMALPQDIQNVLSQGVGMQTMFRINIPRNQIQNILDRVKNIVLDWAIQLENDGIVGEGIRFSKEEKIEAQKQNYTVNNFYGDRSQIQIQQHTVKSTQNQYFEVNKENLRKFIEDLDQNLEDIGLDEFKEEEVKNEIATLSSELNNNSINNKKVKESLDTLRNILEGVAGNIISQGLLYQLELIL